MNRNKEQGWLNYRMSFNRPSKELSSYREEPAFLRRGKTQMALVLEDSMAQAPGLEIINTEAEDQETPVEDQPRSLELIMQEVSQCQTT
jgi:hypothetical protein